MDWVAPVDIYCERLGPGLWAEPVNALTNLSFLLAALLAARTARARGATPMGWLLIVLAALIGIGSGLFHTFATRWAELADTVPIWSFVGLYVLAVVARLRAKPLSAVFIGAVVLAVLGAVAFLATGEGTPPPEPAAPDPLNGSLQYAPAVLALTIFAERMLRARHPQRFWLVGAALAFGLSLGFRTLDRDICATFPLGTHFLWHLLNGLMVGLLLQLYLRLAPPPQPRLATD